MDDYNLGNRGIKTQGKLQPQSWRKKKFDHSHHKLSYQMPRTGFQLQEIQEQFLPEELTIKQEAKSLNKWVLFLMLNINYEVLRTTRM